MNKFLSVLLTAVIFLNVTACENGNQSVETESIIKTTSKATNTAEPTAVSETTTKITTTSTYLFETVPTQNIYPEIIQFGGYDWLVLDIKDGKALILSEKVIEHRKFHSTWTDVIWETCDLRIYLNGEFYNSFKEDDKTRIIEKRIKTNPNPWLTINDINYTNDYIFLLSIEEAVQYFGDSGQLSNIPNEEGWYDNVGTIEWLKKDRYINDQYNSARIAYDNDGFASWWYLRSPSYSEITTTVNKEGHIIVIGNSANLNVEWGGVRPAMWLSLE